jgi:hypothetical protein
MCSEGNPGGHQTRARLAFHLLLLAAWVEAARADHRDARQLQSATCSGNVDTSLNVVCDNGTELLSNADAVVGSDAATCCRCPAGTTTAYSDEALGFRFRAGDITLDVAGLPVWNAATPSGLMFSSSRTIVPNSTETSEMEHHEMFDFPTIPPTIATTEDGLSGLRFQAFSGGSTAVMLFANRKIAIGAQHTIFAAISLEGKPNAFQTLIGMRPNGYETGMVAWTVGSNGQPDAFTSGFGTDTWNTCGWSGGPPLHPSATQLIVARSRFDMDSEGRLGPVMEFATVDLLASQDPTDPTIAWASKMHGDGSKQYFFDQDETFDYDFRDPAIDELRVVGAGYMLLGNQVPIWSAWFQLKAIVHHIEFHSATLSDAHVAQVLQDIRHDLMPQTPPLPVCVECGIGTRDDDNDPTSPCVPCGEGRFSNQVGQVQCEGTCVLGESIATEGATSATACSQCVPGQYGESEDGAPMCFDCEAGRFSTAGGATSAQSCIACAFGTFSQAGSLSCKPSGCMDMYADNYNPHAAVDEGQCAYTCSTLRARVFNATHTHVEEKGGGCVIYDPEHGWQRYTPNGTAVAGGPFIDIPTSGLWVLQGRPQPGSTAANPIYSIYPESTSYVDSDGSCAWRYITFAELVRTRNGIQSIEFAHTIIDHTIAARNSARGAGSWYFTQPERDDPASVAMSDSWVSFNTARDVSGLAMYHVRNIFAFRQLTD